MSAILIFSLVVIVACVLLSLKLKSSRAQEDKFPYVKNGPLFSAAERSFLGVLQQAVGEEFAVLGKVRIADVVSVRSIPNRSTWRKAFNRINAKHFDYVVCSKNDYSIVCVVELDDKSHQQRKRKDRDAFLVNLCRAVSLPLLQVPAQRAYGIADIQKKFLEAIGRVTCLVQSGASSVSPIENESRIQSATSAREINQKPAEGVIKAALNTEVPLCPKCSASMVLREIKTGSKVGQKFWGCSTFPKCRGVTLGG